MKKRPIIDNEALLSSFLESHPEFVRATVCSCGKVLPMSSTPGHIGGSNRKWTIKSAKWQPKHSVAGYTVMARSREALPAPDVPGSIEKRLKALEKVVG